MNKHKSKPFDMTPSTRVVNGKTIYFYSIAQLEYAQNQKREQFWMDRAWASAASSAGSSGGHCSKHRIKEDRN